MSLRQDWPIIDEAISFDSMVGAAAPYKHWVSILDRSLHSNQIHRGREYELNTVQAGEYTATWDNRDGWLSPVNTASPYAANLRPYVSYRKRAMWPPSVNQLTVAQAASTPQAALTFNVDSQIPGWFQSWVVSWFVLTGANSVTGGNTIWRVTYPSSPGNNTPLFDMDGASLRPAATALSPQFSGWHSLTGWVRCSSGTTSPVVAAQLKWRDATGADRPAFSALGTPVTLPVNSSTWVPVTVSAQAPTWAAGVTMSLYSVTGQACVLDSAGWQLEYSQTPSAWTSPGVWY